jgi:uncharacterized membrane protein
MFGCFVATVFVFSYPLYFAASSLKRKDDGEDEAFFIRDSEYFGSYRKVLELVPNIPSLTTAIFIRTVMIHEWVDFAALGLEILAIVIMVTFIAVGTVLALIRYRRKDEGTYARYRVVLARTLQIGLELLVAADIVRTVSTPLTASNLVLLGGVIVVRTFLSWTLSLEIESRWPWQRERQPDADPERAARTTAA